MAYGGKCGQAVYSIEAKEACSVVDRGIHLRHCRNWLKDLLDCAEKNETIHARLPRITNEVNLEEKNVKPLGIH